MDIYIHKGKEYKYGVNPNGDVLLINGNKQKVIPRMYFIDIMFKGLEQVLDTWE